MKIKRLSRQDKETLTANPSTLSSDKRVKTVSPTLFLSQTVNKNFA